MHLSSFGKKFASHSGITQLMDDLNAGILAGEEMVMLGGGNPAQIPEVLARFQQLAEQQLSSGELIHELANYDGPQGNDRFLDTLAQFFNEHYGWQISRDNLALTTAARPPSSICLTCLPVSNPVANARRCCSHWRLNISATRIHLCNRAGLSPSHPPSNTLTSAVLNTMWISPGWR